MKSVRRSIAGIAAAALTTTGLSVLSLATAPEAHAAEVSVDDAVFRWGINTEASSAAFAPGHWNLASAGKVGNPGAGGQRLNSADDGATWSPNATAAGWTNQSGNVTIEDLQTGGTYAPTTFLGTRANTEGVNGTTSNGISGETQLVFRNGTGTVDAAANTASIQWDGDASILYYSGLTFFYLSDPELTVAADGTGEVTATVDGYATSQADPTQWNDLAEQEVTLATLTGVDVEQLGFTSTPDYLGVAYDAPEGATPQSQVNANWGAFPQDFVDFQQLTGGSSYWYSSGSSADVRKPTLPLQVSYDATPAAPSVQVSKTQFLPSGSYAVTVNGTGFDPALATGTRPPLSGKPGGTYVVFGKFAENWRPSLAAPSSSRKNTAQKWAVLAADMATIGGANAGAVELTPQGTFTAVLTVSKSAIDAIATDPSLVNYGIYTYPGSGGVAASYETYTPVTFAAQPGVAEITLDSAPDQDFAGAATITVEDAEGAPATGDVTVTVTDSADVVLTTDTLPLVDGAVPITLLPGNAGEYTVTATYAGNANITEAEATLDYTIAKATATAAVVVTKIPTPLAVGTAKVTVNTSVGTPTGNVQVQVKTSGGAVLGTTSGPIDANGVATVALARRLPGTYALVATQPGSANVNPTTKTVNFTVAKVAAVWSSGWNRKPTPGRTGSLRIRVTGGGVGAATGVLTVRLKNSNGKVLRTARIRLDRAGLATVSLPKLRAGRYAVVATYPGDSKVKPGTTTVRFASVRR
ncbi:Ig-like domain-containing protein [Nocardioides sp. WS12]|uniref:Ig-like domain-containing protein n=1 Tax=Nocardioides sp. WS12 TaxID=2486272 RepID=UPI0015F78AB4|nr:Ig-like domain-containing protein [Nocardioides sp. WS12]